MTKNCRKLNIKPNGVAEIKNSLNRMAQAKKVKCSKKIYGTAIIKFSQGGARQEHLMHCFTNV